MQKKSQQCYCYSCRLYAEENTNTFALETNQGIDIKSQKRMKAQQQPISKSIITSVQDTSDLYIPSAISKIHIQEITSNPIWFYKQYISKNAPVIILGALDGEEICERWASPSYIEEVMQKRKVSISLTPDGFADSIKSDYFIQPYSIKGTISDYLNHKQHYPQSIAYIQQQNSNLSQQMVPLQQQVPFKIIDFLSNVFFDQKMPDAQNIWLGQKESVSSLHKDPYQNFYMPIVGEKHFTLIPPMGILRLQENVYKNAKWNYHEENKNKSSYPSFTAVPDPDNTTRWIYDNPDLESAVLHNKQLIDIKKFHLIVESGQMLYLPSLWYHQVSQCHQKDPYTLSINYWYDMSYGPSYSLYQLCRNLKKI